MDIIVIVIVRVQGSSQSQEPHLEDCPGYSLSLPAKLCVCACVCVMCGFTLAQYLQMRGYRMISLDPDRATQGKIQE